MIHKISHVIKLDLRNPYSDYTTVDGYLKQIIYKLSGEIKSSLLDLKHLRYLDLSWNNFTAIPEFFGSLSSIRYLIFAQSRLIGNAPHRLSNLTNLLQLDLSSNYNLPINNLGWLSRLSSLKYLDMSNVDLKKSSDWLQMVVNMLPYLVVLHLSNSGLQNIPSTHPYVNFTSLAVLDLSGNYFKYTIPTWFYNLSGVFSSSLQNCTRLSIIDLGENMLSGIIPSWIGENLKKLIILRLRSNKFNGSLPQEICNLTSLQVLDLAGNKLSKTIPKCLIDLDAMVTQDTPERPFSFSFRYTFYVERLLVVERGSELEYATYLQLVKSVDFSSNGLRGEIPDELFSLSGLRFLNLSGNYLTGLIPNNIDGLKLLESLDLSRNRLFGEIPQSMTGLTFLDFLNLSDNNLSGRIPASTQLQSFSELSYEGNPELCGAPLLKNCAGEGSHIPPAPDEGDGDMAPWFYIAMAPGFVVGFWGVCGFFYFRKSWRCAYFQSLDNFTN